MSELADRLVAAAETAMARNISPSVYWGPIAKAWRAQEARRAAAAVLREVADAQRPVIFNMDGTPSGWTAMRDRSFLLALADQIESGRSDG